MLGWPSITEGVCCKKLIVTNIIVVHFLLDLSKI